MKWLQGRLNRRDYIVTQIIGSIIIWPWLEEIQSRNNNVEFIVAYTYLVLMPLMVLVAGVTIRRLHDLNRSGWYVMLGLIPVVALVFQVYLMLAKGDPLENKYGKPPTRELDLVHIFFNK